MKLAEILFNDNIDTSVMKFWFGNTCIDLNILQQIWKFLNQDINDPAKRIKGENEVCQFDIQMKPEQSDDMDAMKKAYKKEQDINAIKKAVADRKKVGGRGIPYGDEFDKEIIRLHDEEGMSFIEIGSKMKCSPTTVKTHYDRIKNKENQDG